MIEWLQNNKIYFETIAATLLSMAIPMNPATRSEGIRPAIPIEGGHLIRFIAATLSERSDAGVF